MALLKYPHMLPGDVKIWERWLKINEDKWYDYKYDVHVGKVEPIYETKPINIMNLARAVLRKRIDVVARKDNEIWIFEVKPDAGLGAICQLISYKHLYQEEFRPTETIRLALVTDRLDKDVQTVCQKEGIELFVV